VPVDTVVDTVHLVVDRRPPGQRDRGSTSLTAVVLTPVFVVIAFAAFQAAMWSHARTEARVAARDVAVLVAQRGHDADLVERSAERNLDEGTRISGVEVTITSDRRFVVVRVTGDAPGIIRGTSAGIDVTEALPIEGFRP
jgi:hypothetical protein